MAPLARGASSTNLKTQLSFSVWTEAGAWSQSLSPFEPSNICSLRHTAYRLEGGVQCSGLIPNYSVWDFCVCVCATITHASVSESCSLWFKHGSWERAIMSTIANRWRALEFTGKNG